jgi:fatty-acyl-CoA synthase
VLADNVPEFSFLLGGCAFAGAVLVALNPVRRGEALARDVIRTDCQYVLAEPEYAALLPAMDVPVLPLDGLELPAQAPLEVAPATPDDLLMLIFTSGTSGEPKAVRCTHGKIAVPGRMLAGRFGLGTGDTVYVSMPMFHSNAIMAGWAVGLAAGAAIALRRRFSASGFLPDVRAFGATYANYVGKPLSYVLATPERADDADNPLRIAYGNEGAPADLARFAGRFGCTVIDGFGSTEGGVAISRSPGTPPGALGQLADGVAILHPETGRPCPPASFGPGGELLNPAEAVGELVNTSGPGLFAGYYDDAEADASRIRDGMYWSGDLGYADADGFCWFAGRAGQWLRVDGENLGTAPIERALLRHPAIAEAAVYGVPDPVAGDQVMACIVVRGGGIADAGRARRLPGRAGRHRRQAASAFRPGRGRDAAYGHVQGADPGAGRRPVEHQRSRVVASRTAGPAGTSRSTGARRPRSTPGSGRAGDGARSPDRSAEISRPAPSRAGWQVAHPDPDGVVHRGGDGRVHPGGAELADAPRPDQACRLVVLVGERDVDVGRDVGVDRYRHVGQVLGQPPPVHRLLVALLHGGLAPAPDDAAGHLRAGGDRVDDPAGRVDADRAAQPQQPEVGVDADLGEDHAPGPDRVRRALRRPR